AAESWRLRVDLFEYQAKDLFAEYGVPVQPGKVASTAAGARDIAAEFAAQGHPLVVVKAQVKTGGRGKAGGVKLANGPDEAFDKASQILGMDIKGTRCTRCSSPRRWTSRPSTTSPSCSTGRTARSSPSARCR